jgi:hypothetical protein
VQVRVPEQVQVLQIQEPVQVRVPEQVQALQLRELPAAIKMRHRFRIRRKTSEDP